MTTGQTETRLEEAVWRMEEDEGMGPGTRAGPSAIGNGRRNPAVLLVGLHQTLERGLGFLAAEGFLGLAGFPADSTLR